MCSSGFVSVLGVGLAKHRLGVGRESVFSLTRLTSSTGRNSFFEITVIIGATYKQSQLGEVKTRVRNEFDADLGFDSVSPSLGLQLVLILTRISASAGLAT